ncbi:MAG: universal stress protein [Geothermobacteraceae bacterium]
MPRILIPVDDSETTRKTLVAVAANRRRLPKTLYLLHVVEDNLAWRMIPDFQLDMIRERAKQAGEKLLDEMAAPLEQAGFTVEKLLRSGSARQVIPEVANEENFDLLIIGRHADGGEIRDVLFGSVANYIMHHVRCPVLLV